MQNILIEKKKILKTFIGPLDSAKDTNKSVNNNI